MTEVYKLIKKQKLDGRKLLAVLIDPDKFVRSTGRSFIDSAVKAGVDLFFVGGSLLTHGELDETIIAVKENCNIPVVIFPGSNLHISKEADAILLLSLVSGRNPELLIGQHVTAAPILRKSNIEIISTGYLLIDAGHATTVSYISNTQPIPRNKPEICACTAMASEMLGHQMLYIDAGSGADLPIPSEIISAVSRSVDIPLVVGGGIKTKEAVKTALESGADVIVVGTQLEKRPEFVEQLADLFAEVNSNL